MKEAIQITDMQKAHIARVEELEREIFSVPWSAKVFSDALELDNALFYVALGDGCVAGYCGIYLAADEGEITNVAVAPQYRRRGIGRLLLGRTLLEAEKRGAERIFLEVRQSNGAAQGLYRGFGFVPVGVRRGYYELPAEDAVVMARLPKQEE